MGWWQRDWYVIDLDRKHSMRFWRVKLWLQLNIRDRYYRWRALRRSSVPRYTEADDGSRMTKNVAKTPAPVGNKLLLLLYDLYWLRYQKSGDQWYELTDYLRDKLREDGVAIEYTKDDLLFNGYSMRKFIQSKFPD